MGVAGGSKRVLPQGPACSKTTPPPCCPGACFPPEPLPYPATYRSCSLCISGRCRLRSQVGTAEVGGRGGRPGQRIRGGRLWRTLPSPPALLPALLQGTTHGRTPPPCPHLGDAVAVAEDQWGHAGSAEAVEAAGLALACLAVGAARAARQAAALVVSVVPCGGSEGQERHR